MSTFLDLDLHLKKAVSTMLDENTISHPLFIKEFIDIQINSIQKYFSKLCFADLSKTSSPKTIVFNASDCIPFEHVVPVTLLLLMGHKIHYQVLSKDSLMIKKFFEILNSAFPGITNTLHINPDAFSGADYYITDRPFSAETSTGYFSKKIISLRKKSSIAILNRKETAEEIKLLAADIALFFGSGKGNVKKIFAPLNYTFDSIFEALENYSFFKDHHHYFNHFQYQYSICQLCQEPFLENNFMILKQDNRHSAPLAMVFFDFYQTPDELETKIKSDLYHSIYSSQGWYPNSLSFGNASFQCIEYDDEMSDWIKKINVT